MKMRTLGMLAVVLCLGASIHAQDIQQEGKYVLHPDALFHDEQRVFSNYDGMWASGEAVRNERSVFLNSKPSVEKKEDRTLLLYEGKTEQGSGKKTVTLSGDGYTLDYEQQTIPFNGYGEIGFWIPVEFLTTTEGVITVLDPNNQTIELPKEPGDKNIILRIIDGQKIIVQGDRAVEISMEGMKDCYGGFLQDYRGVTTGSAAHSLRFLVSWSTQQTTHVQGRIRIRVVDKQETKPQASAPSSDGSAVSASPSTGRLQLQSTPPFFITTGQTIQIPVEFTSQTHRENGTLQWRLVNESGGSEQNGTIEVPGDTTQWRHVFDLKMERNGSYRLETQLTAGSDTWKDETLFSVFPPPLNRTPAADDILGASGIMENYGDIAAISGLTWNRRWCGMGDMREALSFKDGKPNVNYLDHADNWEKKRGFIPLGSLTTMTAMYQPRTDWGNPAANDAYLDAWIKNQVEPLVRQTHQHVRYWEVLNEPYYEIREHPEVYVEILKRAYTAIKSIDPALQVVGVCGPGDSIGDEWFRSVFALGAMKYMDILSFHQYCFSNQLISNPEKRFESWFDHLRQLMREYGGRELPLWNDEVSLTPPATMFTLPTYLKNIHYIKGEQSPDPREQAAVMSRLLTVHYAGNVKFFFHLFNASPDYTCVPMEYNGAPIPMAVAMGGAHRFLAGKTPIGVDRSHKRLPIYLFSGDKGEHVAVSWLQRFYPNETAQIQWPKSLNNLKACDLFANSIDHNGPIGPEPVFFTFNSNAPGAELLAQLGNMRVDLRQPEQKDASLVGTLKAADPSDWVGYVPIDLKPYVNRGFADNVAADKIGGFTDEGTNDLSLLPSGDYKSHGVPFRIIDPNANDGKSCLVMGSKLRDYFPMHVEGIKVHHRLTKISFFHLITNGYQSNYGAQNQVIFTYVIHYTDGSQETIPVREGDNIADWWSHKDPLHARIAFEIPNPMTDRVSVFQYDWTSSKGASARVESIDIHSGDGTAIPVVLAITGVLSN
ncbi:MAG: hypothetical protein IT447_03390 [Phycisphaerales bacterium]|nr:hypothetical protein [Phycisphaerales bacterium]